MPSELPEIGKTVLVRGRPYLVEGINPQAFSAAGSGIQHLVTLSCIDENSLDERLSVIWEIEPGATVLEQSSMPLMEHFDEPGDLDAFIHAVHWGVVSQMDQSTMQAPFRSGVEPEDYQLEPVARALTMPRVNLLLADDVGLGKTIEAGLVMQELILRNRVNTVLVVCPAALQVQWKEEMRDKFGLEFRIINSESVSRLRRERGVHANPWTHFPRLITSIDYLKQDHVFQRFRQTLPAGKERRWPRRFDLLIVDEAHNVAPSGSVNYVKASLRTRVIQQIRPHFEHCLFLTATPHNGYSASFSALLELLDDQRFIRGVAPDMDALHQVLVRRMKSEIKGYDGKPKFPERKILPLEVNYTQEETDLYDLLRQYSRLCQSRYSGAGIAKQALHFSLMVLKKRLLSSTSAFLTSIERHIKSRRDKEAVSISLRASIFDNFDDSADDDKERQDELLDVASRAWGKTLPDDERRLLETMREKAAKSSVRSDSKAKKLIGWLNDNLRPDGVWNDIRVVIFTEFRDTQAYIQDLLARNGFKGERVLSINGGTPQDEREAIKAAFQADPRQSPVRILIGTDAASEGINLQNHCSRLIHYEIPWNPSRLEQRNGRVDRHGQLASRVDVYHFAAAGYDRQSLLPSSGALRADMEFLSRVVRKVEQIRLDLGKVGPVIAQQVEKAMLSVDGTIRDLETSRAERDAESARRLLKVDRDIVRTLARVRSTLEETRSNLRLYPQNIQQVVEVALRLSGQPALKPASVAGIPEGKAFFLPGFSGEWSSCREGNEHPFTHEPRPIVFEGDLARDRDDVVYAHLNHKLVTRGLQTLRSQLWAPPENCKLYRSAARIVPSSLTIDPVVVIIGRLIVSGSTNQRIREEMIMAGGRIRSRTFSRFRTLQELDRFWNDACNMEKAQRAAADESTLHDMWRELKEPLFAALEARRDERIKTLESTVSRRLAEEEKRITGIMHDLENRIAKELDELRHPKTYQLSLLDDDEKRSHDADVSMLEARLKGIPLELENELGHLRARYANPRPILLPLAVFWFIPASAARKGGM